MIHSELLGRLVEQVQGRFLQAELDQPHQLLLAARELPKILIIQVAGSYGIQGGAARA